MRIACDTGVSGKAIAAIERAGHEVVYWAREEPDEWWFKEAHEQYRAECFVSHDWDIILMADERNLKSVQIPNGVKGAAQADVVIRALA